MFGYHKARKAEKKAKKAQSAYEKQQNDYQDTPEYLEAQDKLVSEKTAKSKAERNEAKKEGAAYAQEVLGRQQEGLNPQTKQSMQYAANKEIQRGMQSANRKLLGEQASHGIVGKGGVGYAQQRDLDKLGREAKAGVTRDINKLDSDLALKKLAAAYNIEQGEASQAQLDKQLAIDELQLADEKKRQKAYDEKVNNLFNRL